MAVQDQSFFTRNYLAKIVKNGAEPKWHFCKKFEEAVVHLVSGCPIMTPNEYLQRHDRVGQYLHWKICQHYNEPYAKNWYEYKPQKAAEIESATILQGFSIHTDRTIRTNKPDITIKDYKEKTYKIIDFTYPMDKNISAKEFEKLSKYKDLQIEEEGMWQLKTSIIPSCWCSRISEKGNCKTT